MSVSVQTFPKLKTTVYSLALFGCSGRSPINCRCALESFVSSCVEIWKVCNMPSLPLPLPKLSSSMFVAVHREGVPCWLLDSMKNELVSSEVIPPSLVVMPCSVFLQHSCKLAKKC